MEALYYFHCKYRRGLRLGDNYLLGVIQVIIVAHVRFMMHFSVYDIYFRLLLRHSRQLW